MTCRGCGNRLATITRTAYHDGVRSEMCDSADCGNLKAPLLPDVYFRKPYMDPNLANAENPHGVMVESPIHKKRLLDAQGLREDGDAYHGSHFRDAERKPIKFKPAFEKKLKHELRSRVSRFARKA